MSRRPKKPGKIIRYDGRGYESDSCSDPDLAEPKGKGKGKKKDRNERWEVASAPPLERYEYEYEGGGGPEFGRGVPPLGFERGESSASGRRHGKHNNHHQAADFNHGEPAFPHHRHNPDPRAPPQPPPPPRLHGLRSRRPPTPVVRFSDLRRRKAAIPAHPTPAQKWDMCINGGHPILTKQGAYTFYAECGDMWCDECLRNRVRDRRSFPPMCHGRIFPDSMIEQVISPEEFRIYLQEKARWDLDRAITVNMGVCVIM